MSFTGNEDHSITLSAAALLTHNFRILAGIGAHKGEFFGKAAIQEILDQTDCVGIRVYYGHSALLLGTPKMVIVGVKANETDITNGTILENGISCPPNCDITSALSIDL